MARLDRRRSGYLLAQNLVSCSAVEYIERECENGRIPFTLFSGASC